ncbi:hypothetical protein EV143_1169 [Flavobacterium chryseum]|uniref:hypothetical protein n=1 Tax=Flavobacterium sp. P3160 TaxID=2512113 RepID=UPI00105CF1FF|nr:hypothetical protein [Flavobacterium sp. P3160]TDO68899.1 hypothetical protein EV143_1169 [Flavobacterium sp. P3160]
MKYLSIFEKIKEDIIKHPYLELIECQFNSGLSEVELENLKTELYQCVGYFQSIDMKAIYKFYRECNGLTLSWRIASHLNEKEYLELKEKFPDLTFPYTRDLEIGKIKILPFEEVFLYEQNYFDTSNSGDHFTQFNEYIYEGNSFGKMLFIFDLFSETCCMSFVPDEDNKEPKVIFLSDYYIVWDNSRITFFDSYINFLAVTRGLIESRKEIFDHFRGDTKKPIIYKKKYGTDLEPSLFKK